MAPVSLDWEKTKDEKTNSVTRIKNEILFFILTPPLFISWLMYPFNWDNYKNKGKRKNVWITIFFIVISPFPISIIPSQVENSMFDLKRTIAILVKFYGPLEGF